MANPDSDGDGYADGFEVSQGRSPLDPYDHPETDFLSGSRALSAWGEPMQQGLKDSDDDGLPDLFEKEIGSNPGAADTDRDGGDDGIELLNGTDPLTSEQFNQEDSDGDSLFDEAENRLGTNPRSADSDLDRLSDPLELLYQCDPLNPDTNGDGLVDGAQPGPKQFRFVPQLFHF